MEIIKGFLFDVDGVIVDTEGIHFDTYKEVLKPHGVELTWELYKRCMSGKTIDIAVQELEKELRLALDRAKIKGKKIR